MHQSETVQQPPVLIEATSSKHEHVYLSVQTQNNDQTTVFHPETTLILPEFKLVTCILNMYNRLKGEYQI